MENQIIDGNKKISYEIYIKGQKHELTHDELLQLKKLVERLLGHTSNNLSLADALSSTEKTFDNLSLNDVMSFYRPPSIPSAFRQIFESECDPRSPYESVYVYYKDHLDNWGYQVKTKNGSSSSFSTIGKITDIDSVIGEFYSKIPQNREFIKKELASIGSKRVTEGRRLKACVDVLLHERCLEKRTSIEKNVTIYQKVNKTIAPNLNV